ncbi:MAG: peptide chain release factor N(5)-glutamine methyltransferase [Bacilli bacterium]
MTVEVLLTKGKEKIHSSEAKLLLANLLNCNPLELYNHLNEEVPSIIASKFLSQADQVRNKEPIQYVIGTSNFYGNIFTINKNVLIPRFETEELVENTLNLMTSFFPNAKTVIDLGCGSGVIGLTIASKKPEVEVTLLDISLEALEVAKENAKNLHLNATFIASDMWEKVVSRYDVVVCNPPYIRTTDDLDDLVFKNEPHLALFAGLDGLDCYRKFFNGIKDHLNKQYLIALEIGSSQKEDVYSLLKLALPNSQVVIKSDLEGRDRMIFAYETDK